jgi:hypothetical protein
VKWLATSVVELISPTMNIEGLLIGLHGDSQALAYESNS